MNLWLQLLQNYHIPWLPLDKVALLHRLRWKQVAWEHKLFAVDVYLRLLAPAKCRKTAFPPKNRRSARLPNGKSLGPMWIEFRAEDNPIARTTHCVLGLRVIYAFGFGSGVGNFAQITRKRSQFLATATKRGQMDNHEFGKRLCFLIYKPTCQKSQLGCQKLKIFLLMRKVGNSSLPRDFLIN